MYFVTDFSVNGLLPLWSLPFEIQINPYSTFSRRDSVNSGCWACNDHLRGQVDPEKGNRNVQANEILISVAILFLAAAHWDDLRQNDRVTPARKTFLIVACIFALTSVIMRFV